MKILISHLGHIGDVILATSLLPALKSSEVKIGFLTSSSTHEIVKNHPLIDSTHIFNHPKFNRASNENKRKKEGARTFRKALEEIKNEKYDMAIECNYSFSHVNAAVLFYKAGIERRVGFAGSAPYYMNERYFWQREGLHIVEEHKMLLKALGLERLDHVKPCIDFRGQVPEVSLPEKFILVHMGTGDPKRLWSEEKWRILINLLEKLQFPLVFVGRGTEERERIQRVGAGHINLCDQLSLQQFAHVVKRATFLIALESMAGHMAAACSTRALLIYSGLYPVEKWRPYNPICKVVGMEVSPEQIYERVKECLLTS